MQEEKTMIEIRWTCGSLDEARKVCRYLAQERYIAKAEIIPWIESVYLLDNRLETVQESKVIFLADMRDFDRICKVVKENCNYEVPELSASLIDLGDPAYIDWLKTSTPRDFRTESYT